MLTPQPRTCTDVQIELDRNAFNAAFYELGLRWHWDSARYERMAAQPCERQRLRDYLEGEQSHLLRAYDVTFLTDAILAAKQRCREQIAHCAPQSMSRFNWADTRWAEVGV